MNRIREDKMSLQTPEKVYSFEEYCTYDDGTDNHYELVDGKLELMNPPIFRHFLIAKFLEQAFDAQINRLQLPWICLKDAGIRTGWNKSRLPDLYVIPVEQIQENLEQSAIAQTPPLLVVEIVSHESIKRDYRYKRSEYAALEIPEYWIVDPLENQIAILQFAEGLYDEIILSGEQKISSTIFPELNLTPQAILDSGNRK